MPQILQNVLLLYTLLLLLLDLAQDMTLPRLGFLVGWLDKSQNKCFFLDFIIK